MALLVLEGGNCGERHTPFAAEELVALETPGFEPLPDGARVTPEPLRQVGDREVHRDRRWFVAPGRSGSVSSSPSQDIEEGFAGERNQGSGRERRRRGPQLLKRVHTGRNLASIPARH